MNHAKEKRKMRMVRHRRVRARVFGVSAKPRLCVFRSNKNLSAQVFDDVFGKVLASAWTKEIAQGATSAKSGVKKSASGAKHSGKTAKQDSTSAANNIASAEALGAAIAKKAIEKKIKQVVFDRGGYAYHGKIKAFAEGARKGGLVF